MKRRSLLIGLISLFLCLTAQSQVVVKYQQGFEASGETSSYTVTSGTATPVTSLHSSGNRSLHMVRSTSGETIVELDTIDFSDNSTFQYYILEYMGISTCNPLGSQSTNITCIIEARRPTESTWTQLVGSNHYDMSWGGGSSDFAQTNSFNVKSYSEWDLNASNPNNSIWKKERFKLDNFLNGSVSLAQRKLIIRFRITARTNGSLTSGEGWYLDNISVKASPQSLAIPVIDMRCFPDLEEFPTSRAARIEANITTTASAGVQSDSVYILYRVGRAPSAPVVRSQMQAVTGIANRYRGYIPFCGYDTIIYYRVVAKDATLNHNEATYPEDASGWASYRSVRGKANISALATTHTGGSTAYPFPGEGSSKAQFIFDSATLASVGFGPGSITSMSLVANNTVNSSQRTNLQIWAANVATNYAIDATTPKFYTGAKRIVYDSSLLISVNAGTNITINFQDTFFYAGKDILLTVIYNHPSNPAAVGVRTIAAPTSPNKSTIYQSYDSYLQMNPYTDDNFANGMSVATRPNATLRAYGNMPLIYDCGIAGLITPNDSTSASAPGPNSIIVKLHNYGVNTINNARIWYQIDDSTSQYYDWTGSLTGGNEVNVTITSSQYYAHGYHTIAAWTDDSITSGGVRYRDHEPLNNRVSSRFVACTGPMSGNITVGGSGADYASLETALYVLSQCGVNGPLHIKLAAGTYTGPIEFPSIPGTSTSNFVQLEPANNTLGSVTFNTISAGNTGVVRSYIINVGAADHIRFCKIAFTSDVSSWPVTYLVRQTTTSTGCQYLNCSFSEAANSTMPTYSRATALFYSGGADSTLVQNCTFSRGNIGVSMVGPALDNMAHGNSVIGCTFTNQISTSVILRNQVGGVIDTNTMNDVLTNSSYAILLQDCEGATRVTRNLVRVTHGASALGATGFHGTASAYALIANNMLICDDDGTANMLVTPFNVITASYTKVVFNSIKMNAPAHAGVAAATFGGGVIDSCYFLNNIVSCVDTTNYAFNYIPNAGNVNYIGYNIYYSTGAMLNKYNGINCVTFSAWQSQTNDGSSQNVNPAYLLSTPTDLRSYSQSVKSHATPIAEVTNDMFGTARNATAPCVGAFEFVSLPYDFEVYAMIEPYSEYCNVPSSAPLRLAIKNSGVNTYYPNSGNNLYITYSRTSNAGTLSPTNSGTVLIADTIPGDTTIIINVGHNVEFPTNGIYDTTYTFSFWLSSTIDPNPANDTSRFSVTSHYHFPAPTTIHDTITYGTADTIALTAGVQTWPIYVYTNGRQDQSTLYWYTHPDSNYVFRGSPYITPILYTDTMYYVRQRRDMPLVKITEVQTKKNGLGLTNPQPLWMNASCNLAIELTNVGDYPATMQGDTLQLVSNTANLNKIYVFPNVTIQPGKSMVIQYVTGINVDSVNTLGAMVAVSPAWNSNLGVIYRDGSGIVDAVAINNITSQTNWTNQQVPAAAWSGSGVTLDNQTAGISRTHWPAATAATPSNMSQFWQVADSTHTMTMGTVSENLIRYTDNGCPADVNPVYVHIDSRPAIDIALDALDMPEGCGLATENVTVTIHNYGSTTSDPFEVHYSINDSLVCTDTVSAIGSNGTLSHTFSVPANLYVAHGSQQFDFCVWADSQNGDISLFNDTARVSIVSYYTPSAPVVRTYDTVTYGSRAILTTLVPSTDSLAWYDGQMNPLDTVNTYITDYIYQDETFYVTAFGTQVTTIEVGQMNLVSAFTAHPSPYNPNNKYAKEQYIYTADELIAAGHSAGPITAVAFYLDSIKTANNTPNPSCTFDVYTVGIGTTTQSIFTSNNDWQDVNILVTENNLTLTNADKGWITHTFSTPFYWDGVSNLVVEVCHSASTKYTNGARTRYSTKSNTTLYKADDNTSAVATFSGAGTRHANRPNARFTFSDLHCESPASPIYVTSTGVPAVDAAIQWPDGMDTVAYSSCGTINFDINVINSGTGNISNYAISYLIDDISGNYTGTDTILPHASVIKTIATPMLTPGRHFLQAVIQATGDSVNTNDTIATIISVTFCAGNYTIGVGSTYDYQSFTEAVDTLKYAGIEGPIVFNVANGTYNEQVGIGDIKGTSATNAITFRSATGDSAGVVLRYTCSATSDYVLGLDNAKYITFEHITIYAFSSNNNATAVTLSNADHINFTGDIIRVKGTINNVNANCIIVGEQVTNLGFDSCWIDSGYCSLRTKVGTTGLNAGLRIDDCRITNFWSQGLYVRKVSDVVIRRNQIRSGVGVNGRALTGIFIAESEGGIDVEMNNVVLYDTRNGGKRGIVAISCTATNTIRGMIYNNMCAIYGTGTAGQTPAGIWIDSSHYMNVYYNTAKVYAGASAANTRTFSVNTNSTNIHVLNNIFFNESKGYAYYVENVANVVSSNYNVYYSTSTERLCYFGGELPTLDTLRQVNGMDGNSLVDMPYFYGNDDLHLMYALYAEMAQYRTEVPTDIDGEIRPQIPQPCIGADEIDRNIHDIAIMQFMEPTLDSNTVESDSLRIVVKLYNEGTSTETNVRWRSNIVNPQYNLSTPWRTIAEISPTQIIYDTAYIQLPIGLIDTQYIHAEIDYAQGQTVNDGNLLNNSVDTVFFIEPAFDIQATQVFVNDSTSGVKGCRLQETPVTIRLTNVGRKAIPVDHPITIGYQAIMQTTGVTVTQIPLVHSENATLSAPLEVGDATDITFVTPANLYPTGVEKDVVMRIRGFSTYIYDQKHAAALPGHDTTAYTNVSSKYTPNRPQAADLHIPYATWDTIFATHTDHPTPTSNVHRPIRWYRDSTDASPFFDPGNYNASTWWETPQYFRDTVYYLSCISASGCTSYYQPVHVYINARVGYDAAIEAFTEPYDKTYMDNDTVKVRIINYGTQTISNIPVVYQFRREGNNQPIIQEVREVCTASIAPNDTYVFKFDSLIYFPTNQLTGNVNYTLRTWTDLATEQTRLNDTLRNKLVVKQLPENHYSTPTLTSSAGLDIIQVSFNSLDNYVPEVGHTYLNFGDYTAPYVEHLRLQKGSTDTMVITVANSDDHSDYNTGGYLTVYIDYNRDGVFSVPDTTLDEPALYSEIVFADTIRSRVPKRFVFTYPDSACLGYIRMRVCVEQSGHAPMAEPFDFGYGQVQDYMLLVEDAPVQTDVALSRIISPRSNFITGDSTVVTFLMVNKGAQPVETAEISWTRTNMLATDAFTWTGHLDPGQTVPVSLPTLYLNEGTTDFIISVTVPGDTISDNDTIRYQAHRFKTVTLILSENFDEPTRSWFYAPRGYTNWSTNVWQKGFPYGKLTLTSCVSDSTVWATNLSGQVNTGRWGNLSYLYTPIIDISQIRADTISFWLAQDLADGAVVSVEFWNYLDQWVTLGSANDTMWYNDPSGFAGATSGNAYVRYLYPTSHVSGDMQQHLQFRIVYHAAENTPAADGVCLDDFTIGRAQRAIDVGVAAIVYPTEPKFGQTIRPRVAIANYGYDTAYSVNLAYRPYGTNLAMTGTYQGAIPPGGTDIYEFPDAFTVMSDFPDTFQICAYTTVNLDIYWENDSTCQDFYLSPLDNDMAITEFLYPLDHIVAGDSLQVTVRLRNYGMDPVSACDVGYNFNNNVYNEHVDFEALLGRQLESFEYFNYTFHQRVQASMGTMHLTSWVHMETDDYPYNDTVTKTIEGLSNITDLSARCIVLDTSSQTQVSFQITIDNIGSRGANNFTVGYWYDNDTSTMVIERFSMALPLASLATAYYVFDSVQPRRSGNPYTYVSGFVHVEGDNDPSNDTTSSIESQYIDLRPIRILVEENRNNECNVRMEVENIGNMAYRREFRVNAVINGNSIRTITNRVIPPGEVYSIDFNNTIPKSSSREYTGSGFVSNPNTDASPYQDANEANNQTSVIDVINYFDGILAASANGMTLDQNVPNPFRDRTRIDFSIPTAGQVQFFVMDAMGRLIYQSVDDYDAGANSVYFAMPTLTSGTYYYGIKFEGEQLMRKMVFKR